MKCNCKQVLQRPGISVLIFIFLISIIPSSYGQKKQVCFSIDDLPVVSYGIADTSFQRDLTEKLLLSLKKNEIPAIGFVNEIKLYDNESINHFQVSLLQSWVNNGLELGNHTYSHPDINSVPFTAYLQDILKGEIITKQILHSKEKEIVYFRHPYLHVGNTKEKADSLNSFLLKHNYKVAPVTVDNEDYLFALAYKRAKVSNNEELSARIGHDYIDYMEQKLRYYEKQSNKLFGRNITQILLLHSSSLNSDYVDSLAIMFRKNNYEFVSMDKALEDGAYKTEINRFGNWGISWIDRWTMSQGKKNDFYAGEPVTPEYINKLAQ